MDLEKTRKALRLSQAEIAGLLGISRVAWGALERGASIPHKETRERLNDLLQAVVAGSLFVKDKQWEMPDAAISSFGVNAPWEALTMTLDDGLSPLAAMISVFGYGRVRGALIRHHLGFGHKFCATTKEEEWMMDILTIMPDSPILEVLHTFVRGKKDGHERDE